jgi:hypothetical protein
MTVKELIKELKKLPGDLDVGVAAHDNDEWEIAGWVGTVDLFDREELMGLYELDESLSEEDLRRFEDQPEQAVVLRC